MINAVNDLIEALGKRRETEIAAGTANAKGRDERWRICVNAEPEVNDV